MPRPLKSDVTDASDTATPTSPIKFIIKANEDMPGRGSHIASESEVIPEESESHILWPVTSASEYRYHTNSFGRERGL